MIGVGAALGITYFSTSSCGCEGEESDHLVKNLVPTKKNVTFDLSGKVAFITGGATGIGKACALVLAHSGCDVVIVDVNKKLAEETAEEVRRKTGRRALSFNVDVRNYGALEAAAQETVAKLGSLDFCVANAGIGREASVLTMEEEDLSTIIDINMKGVFFTVKACAREMVKQNRGGRVVTISSINAKIAGAGASAYCGTKAAVKMMVRCWAQDLIPYGITVNCIGPGATDTALMISQVDHPDARKGLLNAIPSGRMALPEEVGWLTAFFCSDEAAYLTGTFIAQDGGLRDHNSGATEELARIVQRRNTVEGKAILEEKDKSHYDQKEQARAQRSKFGVQ